MGKRLILPGAATETCVDTVDYMPVYKHQKFAKAKTTAAIKT